MYNCDKKSKKSLGAQIEDELMKYILQKPVGLGEKIPNEFELAERFGVGRSTIREAVKGLVSRGILEVRRGSGTYVVSTNSLDDDPLGLGKIEDKYKTALDLFDVRLMIEPEIAALACRNASSKDLERLKLLCDETERLYRSGHDHISKDIEFHTCIAKCSKNLVVETLVPVINTAVYTFANLTHRLLIEETLETHRAVTDSILKRDSVGARCAMMMHLTYNRQTIIRLIEERDCKEDKKTNTSDELRNK
ncbi:MAG: FadR family transcriptional regulator [Dorea sp.]|jgi:GntR family transcriptional repressor for pyruvate dehydrogenase complex|nr:FadR family transcriptional regulator [Dorea sp.]